MSNGCAIRVQPANVSHKKAKQKRPGKPKCWGPGEDQHLDTCSRATPRCTWRRAATRCYCLAYHYPHRKGSGKCATGLNEVVYRPTAPTAIGEATPSGRKMSEARWWNARAAVASMLEGALAIAVAAPVLLTADMLAYAAAVLTGEASAPAAKHGIPRGNLAKVRAWYVVRRAVSDLIVPHLAAWEGTVLPHEAAVAARELLAGTRKPPVLPDARKLAKTKGKGFAVEEERPDPKAAVPF